MNIFSGQGQEKVYFHPWENKYLQVLVICVIAPKTKIASGKEYFPQNYDLKSSLG